ncbi:rhodanese-like domain-containing protein [Almyronema epifaneia]|uniref:Rhodanese-like domain-containing protein n=1 Tax=Almyronema epifaneia S1 TaxID=2991925 RepID=A0ABW6IEF9_9CYAN
MFPKPDPLKAHSRVYDLKLRLDWGEPALTIIDVRERQLFLQARILGAVSMPMAVLVDSAQASLEPERDLYVYAETDEEAAEAVARLQSAGFQNVSLLRGGVAAWKAVGFPIESSGNRAA